MLVGNKSDLKHLRDVQTDMAQAFCEREVGARAAVRWTSLGLQNIPDWA